MALAAPASDPPRFVFAPIAKAVGARAPANAACAVCGTPPTRPVTPTVVFVMNPSHKNGEDQAEPIAEKDVVEFLMNPMFGPVAEAL